MMMKIGIDLKGEGQNTYRKIYAFDAAHGKTVISGVGGTRYNLVPIHSCEFNPIFAEKIA